jgi:hypothetical protein
LTVGVLKAALARWGPCALIDRSSPVYNATLLMELCKARVREANIVQCAAHLLRPPLSCDVNARPAGEHGCTALIIASSRGMPKLVELLLSAGADPTLAGEGRFRLSSSATGRKSLCGRRTACVTRGDSHEASRPCTCH